MAKSGTDEFALETTLLMIIASEATSDLAKNLAMELLDNYDRMIGYLCLTSYLIVNNDSFANEILEHIEGNRDNLFKLP